MFCGSDTCHVGRRLSECCRVLGDHAGFAVFLGLPVASATAHVNRSVHVFTMSTLRGRASQKSVCLRHASGVLYVKRV
jgi:hypothetical protein